MNDTRPDHARILVVEDDPDHAALALAAIRGIRRSVDTELIDNGRDAVEALTSGEPLPALTLLDINLPLLSGLEVLRLTRESERFPRPVVVVLTTSNNETDRERALALGCDAFHVKPMSYPDFVMLMREIMNRWLPLPAGSAVEA